jgi:hypothetical protein
MKSIQYIILSLLLVLFHQVKAQQVPSPEENIAFLTTFSSGADKQWGDDDYVQSFFFVVPKSTFGAVFIKVFDPNIGGKHDVVNGDGVFNSKTKFMVYGGGGAFSDPDARNIEPITNQVHY